MTQSGDELASGNCRTIFAGVIRAVIRNGSMPGDWGAYVVVEPDLPRPRLRASAREILPRRSGITCSSRPFSADKHPDHAPAALPGVQSLRRAKPPPPESLVMM